MGTMKFTIWLYSELDSFGSSTVPGHLRIYIFVLPECQSLTTFNYPVIFLNLLAALTLLLVVHF